MLRQIRLISRLQLCNLFGLNELRFTKDRKKRNRSVALGVLWLFLILMLMSYMGGLSWILIRFGIPDSVPVYLFTITALFILFFTAIKAGSVIFEAGSYELLLSLPVSKTAIIISRFLTMYTTNLLISLAVMLPGLAVYAVILKPGPLFYLSSLVGTLLLPLLPITLATAVGALIMAVSARMRYKSIVSAGLSLVLAVGIIAISSSSSSMSSLDMDSMENITGLISEQLQTLYPPAAWFGAATAGGELTGLLLLASVSLAAFLLLLAALQRYFLRICQALHSVSAKSDYRLGQLKSGSPLGALWRRELRRYFASSLYISNTVIGYIMMAGASMMLFFYGQERLLAQSGLLLNLDPLLPFLIALIASLSCTTGSSISMEGKQWWIVKSLPVENRDIYNAKILVNLTVALPFYLIAAVFCCLSVEPNVITWLKLFLIPAVYILYFSVLGITMNLAFPVLNWENEAQVVKQSASVMLSILIGFLSVAPGIFFALLLNKHRAADLAAAAILACILLLTAALYRKNLRTTLE